MALYSHGICGMMLGEVYGMTDLNRAANIKSAVEKALAFQHHWQRRPIPSEFAGDRGGWRYLHQLENGQPYSDLSVTGWQVMFMRSAHNAGFDVPYAHVNDTMNYIRRCFDPECGGFRYAICNRTRVTRATTGAGVLCLFLSGNYDDQIERKAGAWMLEKPLVRYNEGVSSYFYAAYYYRQASYQLGGKYWELTYPPLAKSLVNQQLGDGSWHEDHHNSEYGKAYSTSMAILTLTPPYQLLPIYQR